MKTALITYRKSINFKTIKDFKRKLCYDHYFIITKNNNLGEEHLDRLKKITVIECCGKEIPEMINQIFDKHSRHYRLLPFFRGEVNSKYAIKIYNKFYGTSVDPKAFRLKSHMNKFLGEELGQKKTLNFSYDKLKAVTYQQLKHKLGASFIVKPVNAASSILNFKISSAKEFASAKKKLKRKYKYVAEEYLEGNLYSLDFYSDGSDIFLLCFVREIPFLELLENFSPRYLEKYYKYLSTEFLHFLPIRYTLDFKKLSPLERDFVKKIGEQLLAKKYRGFIHLEYKVKRKEGKIGFIEWGARPGGKRVEFVNTMFNYRVENLPFDLLVKKDYSRFEKKDGLYFLKNRDIDKNILMIYTSVLEKTNIINVLSKIPNYLNISFEDFLKNYLWDNWRIRVKNIEFFLQTNSEGYIFPFYERSDTKLHYIMEFEEEAFCRFVKRKHKILEHLVFQDYNNKQ